MSQYELINRLTAAADNVESRALTYEGEGPYFVLIDELAEDYGINEQYIPLLIEMLMEHIPGMDAEIIDNEIVLYIDDHQNQSMLFTTERMEILLDNALDWIGEMSSGSDLYDTLKNVIGMTDDEIQAAGFDSLSEYFEEAKQQEPQIDPYVEAPDFCSRLLQIPGIDEWRLADWAQHAFEMAVIDEEDGAPREEARQTALDGYAEAFERIGRRYGSEVAAAIFNDEVGYVTHELYGVADFIANGGDIETAREMARDGMFEGIAVPGEEPAEQGFFHRL